MNSDARFPVWLLVRDRPFQGLAVPRAISDDDALVSRPSET